MPRNYVDNAYNRSVGRVGMPVGSAVISRSSGGGGGYSSGGYSSSSGFSSTSSRSYVDNPMNRSLGRVGLPVGSAVHSRSSGSTSYSSSSSSPRTYVDNASNRALGRVGLPVGSAVHSRSSGTTSYSSSSSSPRTYVDNASNRALGRVGLPLGSAVNSRSSSGVSSSSSAKIYVDNPQNRALGRVGLEHGTAVHSKASSTKSQSVARSGGVYVDNAYNRRLGRVGLPYGSAVASKATGSGVATGAPNKPRCYVDNPMNRRLGRVGLPIGTAPITYSHKIYAMPRSPFEEDECFQPLQRIDPEDHNLNEIMQQIVQLREELMNNANPDPIREQKCEAAIGIVNRHEAALTKYTNKLTTPEWVRGGEVISFEDLEMGHKLGGGGFGDVFVGFWKGNQVAIKKLRLQRVAQAKKLQFQAEVRVLSQLNHRAIVRFYGACVTPPNLAIVMEFMPGGSMYDILHVEVRPLSREQKENMITDCLDALKYLHRKDVTHRDIKSMNVLICEDYSHCKLADFGIAIKEDTRSSASVADHSVAGTWPYSAPEILEGKRLKLEELKCADVYSMAVVIVEFLTMKIPFHRMNMHQIRRAVLANERPKMDGIKDGATKSLLWRGMEASPTCRPTASEFFREWETAKLAGALSRLDIQTSSETESTSAFPHSLPLSTISSADSAIKSLKEEPFIKVRH